MRTMDNPYESHKAGFVAVLGRPNVGKSTLINSMLDQKIAAVSPRPQTTRKRQLGIINITSDDQYAQIILIDTPGFHKPRHKLGELMNREASATLEDSDLILFVVDVSVPPNHNDRLLFALLIQLTQSIPIIMILNKIDLIDNDTYERNRSEYSKGVPQALSIPISATRGDNFNQLFEKLLDHLPDSPPYYPEDQVTDLYEREIAADLIREAALILLRDEVPHGIAIRIDQFTERNDHGAYIEATVFVERESHKSIVIGKGGKMIKEIGSTARKEIEAMSGRKVYLQLRVKVRKNWRDDEKVLKRFGY